MKDDTISRQAVLKLLYALPPEEFMTKALLIQGVKQMDAAQPERTNCKFCHAVQGLVDRFERILRDIREAQVDDSVCGMCEYDGAFVGSSGDWCNECPGFEKDDCFKLSDECRKRWVKEAIDGVEK